MDRISYTEAVSKKGGVTDMRHAAEAKDWKPMRLDYVGQVAELMRGGTGSRQDGGNPGFNKGNA